MDHPSTLQPREQATFDAIAARHDRELRATFSQALRTHAPSLDPAARAADHQATVVGLRRAAWAACAAAAVLVAEAARTAEFAVLLLAAAGLGLAGYVLIGYRRHRDRGPALVAATRRGHDTAVDQLVEQANAVGPTAVLEALARTF